MIPNHFTSIDTVRTTNLNYIKQFWVDYDYEIFTSICLYLYIATNFQISWYLLPRLKTALRTFKFDNINNSRTENLLVKLSFDEAIQFRTAFSFDTCPNEFSKNWCSTDEFPSRYSLASSNDDGFLDDNKFMIFSWHEFEIEVWCSSRYLWWL